MFAKLHTKLQVQESDQCLCMCCIVCVYYRRWCYSSLVLCQGSISRLHSIIDGELDDGQNSWCIWRNINQDWLISKCSMFELKFNIMYIQGDNTIIHSKHDDVHYSYSDSAYGWKINQHLPMSKSSLILYVWIKIQYYVLLKVLHYIYNKPVRQKQQMNWTTIINLSVWYWFVVYMNI